MSPIAQERCFNHRQREAVARCPACRRFYCRECVTEHGGRVLCAACLKGLVAGEERRAPRLRAALIAGGCVASFLLLWFLFYFIGLGLLRLPSSFHEGTLWRESSGSLHED